MNEVTHKTLDDGYAQGITTAIVDDGDPLPVLSIRVGDSDSCLLDKKQTEELVRDLQRKLAEL